MISKNRVVILILAGALTRSDEAAQRDHNNLLHGRLLDGMLRSMTLSWRDDAAAGLSTHHFHNNYAKWVIQDHSALTEFLEP
jgi:hypothetical protein